MTEEFNEGKKYFYAGPKYFYEVIPEYFLKFIPQNLLRILKIEKKPFNWKAYLFSGFLLSFIVLIVIGSIISLKEGVFIEFITDIRWWMGFASFGIAFGFIKYVSMEFKKSVSEIKELVEDRKEIENIETKIINYGWVIPWGALSLLPTLRFLVFHSDAPRPLQIYSHGEIVLSYFTMIIWILSIIFTGTFIYFNIMFILHWLRLLTKLKYKLVYTTEKINAAIYRVWELSIVIALMWTFAMSYVFVIFKNMDKQDKIGTPESIIFYIGTFLAIGILIAGSYFIPRIVRQIKHNVKGHFKGFDAIELKRKSLLANSFDSSEMEKYEVSYDFLKDIESISETPTFAIIVVLIYNVVNLILKIIVD